eukprot:3228041-Rhodomonas_salina.2
MRALSRVHSFSRHCDCFGRDMTPPVMRRFTRRTARSTSRSVTAEAHASPPPPHDDIARRRIVWAPR